MVGMVGSFQPSVRKSACCTGTIAALSPKMESWYVARQRPCGQSAELLEQDEIQQAMNKEREMEDAELPQATKEEKQLPDVELPQASFATAASSSACSSSVPVASAASFAVAASSSTCSSSVRIASAASAVAPAEAEVESIPSAQKRSSPVTTWRRQDPGGTDRTSPSPQPKGYVGVLHASPLPRPTLAAAAGKGSVAAKARAMSKKKKCMLPFGYADDDPRLQHMKQITNFPGQVSVSIASI
eukprot:gnl/TRDRNA2_/TRDRNA2_145461_c1_seq1.p1 gnl/TRDRNA2_/TRDRNA2_145461_c1~~gnl/TRDRNA2_/TRDRNA2_145461_c1_seq1.p1  ORF type:complete len:243 (-),score=37.02 gnl/TRDRNA2_/TRDRNA2_145461_c1_seq1:83-811(-)